MALARFVASFVGVAAIVGVQAQALALRVVVLEGEDAVNVVQQKTAVRPLVEIRDRNNLPVAGATVTFTIGTGQPAAFAGGVQTLTVTTNAAGQAAAGGFNVLGSGAVQIQVQAAYQGQIATAAISQTNFATAAAASQAGAASGAGGGSGGTSGAAGGAGGSGGGISGTTIAIVGAAVAGGAVAVTQTGLIGDGGGTTYTGTFTGDIVVSTVTRSQGGAATCVSTRAVSGTLRMELRDGDTNGTMTTEGTVRETSVTGAPCSPLNNPSVGFNHEGTVSGGPSTLTGSIQTSFTGTTPATVTATETISFNGALANGAITGTLTYTHTTRGSGANGSTIAGDGMTSFPVTLR